MLRGIVYSLGLLSTLSTTAACGNCGCCGKGSSSPLRTTVASASATTDDGAALRARLEAALRNKGPAYIPRTRHKNADGSPRYINRLILEDSPYLLQHAHNPVDWYPWGEEAFARARATGRPILLSVGYSTCHWCHVMEEESFEDEEIARYINAHYLPIKVDREIRPDVDAVYMSFIKALTGRGGWPMTVWLTPEREPFFGGTYFAPRDGVRGARRGFLSILREEADWFARDPRGVLEEAKKLEAHVQKLEEVSPAGDLPGKDAIALAASLAMAGYDAENGGTRGVPKFPSSFPLRLLLRHARRGGEGRAREMAIDTARKIAAGGIHDQLGGGFHRYATDARWMIPHFEKMLYDNARLAISYLEAGAAAEDPSLHEVSRRTLDYLLREMLSPEGLFYSATDADSPAPSGRREEGLFFTWTPAEMESVLGAEAARVAMAYFGVTPQGNFEGRSVLSAGRSKERASSEVERARELLFAARQKRPPPHRDDKILVGWNALAVSALSRAAITLGEARYAARAERAALMLVADLRKGLPLGHRIVGGKGQGVAFLDDHVYLAAALLDVFELTADPAWLKDAAALLDRVEALFADPAHGGYFLTPADGEKLLSRSRPDEDGALPSGNSVAALVLLRLHALTGEDRFRARAETTLRAFAEPLAAWPLSLSELLLAVDFGTDAVKEIAVVVPEGARGGALSKEARPFLDALHTSFVPNAVIVAATQAQIDGALSKAVPWLEGKVPQNGRATAYVCERQVCKAPTTDPAVFRRQIREVAELR